MFLSQNKNRIYHIGIIDYLQVWSLQKKLERLGKSIKNKKAYMKGSAVPPKIYGKRFADFMKTTVFRKANEE